MKTIKIFTTTIFLALSLTITAQSKKIDATKSTINWVGKKVTGQHSGTLTVKDGALLFKKSKLAGGTINVNMSTVAVTDLKSGEGKEDLEGHLKADDFFGVTKYPTAKIIFKKITDKKNGVYNVMGDLTIKGITNPINFELTTTADSATSSLKIDRTKYGIKYNSGNFFQNLGDKVISDEFELNVILKY
jgi:polyisoprenoid-binding protein YceI